MDCGVFAIAAVTALAFNIDPSAVKFKQQDMQPHIVICFKNQKFTLFPVIILQQNSYSYISLTINCVIK